MSVLEIIGVAVGVIYLYFEWRASIWLWAASIVMPAIYIFVYFESGFYADMAMNGYYLGASIYGWLYWTIGRKKENKLPITHIPRQKIVPLIAIGVVLWGAIWLALVRFTDSTVPIGDAFTTAASVVAMWALSRKYAEQWLIWLAVDVVCTALYLYKGLYPTAVLYGAYSVIALFGYFKWRKEVVING